MASISVVICCYNSEKVIEETIKCFQNQKFSNETWEIILVNNNSSDLTTQLANEVWYKNPIPSINFRIVDEPNPGLSNARTRGIIEAKYEIISFIDDDNHVPENWISYQAQVFNNPQIGILGCTAIGKFNISPPEWYQNNLLHQFAFATGRLYEGKFVDITEIGGVYGAGMSIRKEIFEKLYEKNWTPLLSGRVGDKQTGGEDSEICLAARLLGYKLFYTNEIEITHYILNHRITWERLEKMTYGFGASDVYNLVYEIVYAEKTGKSNFLTQLRKKWWFNYMGKKINLARNLKKISDPRDAKIYQLRINGFCDTIKAEKHKFESAFQTVKKLI